MDIKNALPRILRVTIENFGLPHEIKVIGREVCMVDLGYRKLKVRVSYKYDRKKREDSFLEILEFHKILQEKVFGVPEVIKFIDEGAWKYKFVEWMEGNDFVALAKQWNGLKLIPRRVFYSFGRFMLEVKKLEFYGKDTHWRNIFCRTDKKAIVLCDYGSWSLSQNIEEEKLFIETVSSFMSKEQRKTFYKGYEYAAKY